MLEEGRAVTAGPSPAIALSARTKAAGRSPGNRRLLEVGLGANMALRLAFLFFIAGLMPRSLLRPFMDSRRCPAICCGVVDCLSPPPASRSGDGPTTPSSQGAYWRRLTGSARVPHNSRYFQCRLRLVFPLLPTQPGSPQPSQPLSAAPLPGSPCPHSAALPASGCPA